MPGVEHPGTQLEGMGSRAIGNTVGCEIEGGGGGGSWELCKESEGDRISTWRGAGRLAAGIHGPVVVVVFVHTPRLAGWLTPGGGAHAREFWVLKFSLHFDDEVR